MQTPDRHPRESTSPLLRTSSLLIIIACTAHAGAQHAVEVIDYVPGQGNSGAYANPASALGPPTRISNSAVDPSVVTPFQPAWRPDELVTIGVGGRLVLAFEEPVVDDPANPFGADLIIFGNSFFTASNPQSPCVGTIYEEGGLIEVSLDGIDFRPIEGALADGLFPTLGYLDAEPFGTTAGMEESDFTRPVDPAMAELMLEGMCWDELLTSYGGSGGGTPIDIGPTGLAAIRFVRITTPTGSKFLPEIDAVSDVAPGGVASDLDGNGTVDGGDLTLLLGAWGETGSPFDLDGDGVIAGSDLTRLLGDWT